MTATSSKEVSRSPSEARSTPSSTMEPYVPGPGNALPLYVADSQPGSRSTSSNSPRSSTPVGQPRLASVNEAYLLRHFQRHLAPWVHTTSNTIFLVTNTLSA